MRISAALVAVTFALATSLAVHAEEKRKADFSQSELKAKIDYCKTCHGLQGQGFRGSYPMPRLAGQQPEYLVNQLQAFIERRRNNPVMFNVAHVLSPEMEKALAQQFHDLDPKPLDGISRENLTEGKKIYLEGVVKSDVPPCASCHGDDARGRDAFPRLAGQLHDYVYKKLTNWDKERGQDKNNPDNSAIMQPIAHNLTDAQIRAVATYLSSLE
ncbi:c-type cytochrome [Bradyrhizobium sp.]|jgi:cytochrome c553|uniref:c-type cytochrome n=1 Tax=Bradyrhizobium sp. TaxID=376 RepID=UPI003C21A992